MRAWGDGLDAQLIDLIGVTNLIPGPKSTEMAMHVGRLRAGGIGLVVAGLAFILPAAAISSSRSAGSRDSPPRRRASALNTPLTLR